MELIIGAVFNKYMGFSSAPDVLPFKRFQAYWEFTDKNKYKAGINNKDILAQVDDIKDDRIKFAEKLLHYFPSRDNYQEFLELILMFIGKTPSHRIGFMAPGAMRHA
ncbi:hypothetical protein AVEN_177535-1 [Araneus ventricosus]|uniref:Uncharacterized protein n=1 Tax=Araneus ventricosus TaxID=182803 RepID=A0A4Y1ZVY8_ARAVE|nr:hypothetical protein AVEN_177535-1 [Araneus ventricosus]